MPWHADTTCWQDAEAARGAAVTTAKHALAAWATEQGGAAVAVGRGALGAGGGGGSEGQAVSRSVRPAEERVGEEAPRATALRSVALSATRFPQWS